MSSIFSCVCWPPRVFFGEMSIQVLCPFFNWIMLSCMGSFYTYWISTLYLMIYRLQIFSLIIKEMQIKTTMRYYFTLVRLVIIKKSTNNQCWQLQRNPCAPLVGLWIGTATVENSTEFSQKIKNRTAISPSNPTSKYLSKENGNTNLKRYMLCSLWHYLQ